MASEMTGVQRGSGGGSEGFQRGSVPSVSLSSSSSSAAAAGPGVMHKWDLRAKGEGPPREAGDPSRWSPPRARASCCCKLPTCTVTGKGTVRHSQAQSQAQSGTVTGTVGRRLRHTCGCLGVCGVTIVSHTPAPAGRGSARRRRPA
eukprot:512050-Pyramimonas_sp.AAC.1